MLSLGRASGLVAVREQFCSYAWLYWAMPASSSSLFECARVQRTCGIQPTPNASVDASGVVDGVGVEAVVELAVVLLLDVCADLVLVPKATVTRPAPL